jgi:hypothetical protein
MLALLRALVIVSFLAWLPQAQAQSPDAGAPGAEPSGQVISANGFTCNKVGNGVTCKGSFVDLDKKLTLTAAGQQQVQLSAEKGKTTYHYWSHTGCLCAAEKSFIKCTDRKGKSKTFKGKEMVQESTTFCTGGNVK